MKSVVAAGIPPLTPETPPQLIAGISQASRLAFMDGLHTAFTLSTVLAAATIVLAFWIKAGRKPTGPGAAHL